jgi:2-hydroxychromene-2-carboxylate isomerase
MRTVEFFFGVGSRYSYLAATQIPIIAADTNVTFVWRPMHSRELIAAAGNDPFRPEATRGQYEPEYRRRDASRWADYYGVPYIEPDWPGTDWKLLAMACIAAGQLGVAERFAQLVFAASFGAGEAPRNTTELRELAVAAGLDGQSFLDLIHAESTRELHSRNVDDARCAGAFGVPTFVTDDGQLFWGQDRIPLLRRHLAVTRT